MFKILTILLLFGFRTHLAAQVKLLDLPLIFDSALEISSLAILGDSVFLPSEKCKTIFILKRSRNKIASTINLNKGILEGKPVEIEGCTLYKNHLLLTDELNASIYNYNFLDNSIREIKTDHDLSNDVGSYGMEGIAADSVNNICYVLKEKNGNSQSEVHVFKILIQDDNITLQFLKNIDIEQPDNSWRYSDLYYNYEDHYLYCLKSRPGVYQIDTIATNFATGVGNVIIRVDKQKLFKDVSNEVNNFGAQGYSTNMEGITMYDNKIYLISDNSQTSEPACNVVGNGKTLFLKLSAQ